MRSRAPAYDRSKAAGDREMRRTAARGSVMSLHPTAIVRPETVLHRQADRAGAAGVPGAGGRRLRLGRRARCRSRRARGPRPARPGRALLSSWLSIAVRARSRARHRSVRDRGSSRRSGRMGVPFVALYSRLFRREPLSAPSSLRAVRCRRVLGEKARPRAGHQARPFAETIRDSARWLRERAWPGRGGGSVTTTISLAASSASSGSGSASAIMFVSLFFVGGAAPLPAGACSTTWSRRVGDDGGAALLSVHLGAGIAAARWLFDPARRDVSRPLRQPHTGVPAAAAAHFAADAAVEYMLSAVFFNLVNGSTALAGRFGAGSSGDRTGFSADCSRTWAPSRRCSGECTLGCHPASAGRSAIRSRAATACRRAASSAGSPVRLLRRDRRVERLRPGHGRPAQLRFPRLDARQPRAASP